MRRVHQLFQILRIVGLASLAVSVSGCLHSNGKRVASRIQAGEWYLSYLRSETHQRLYVEVDSVAGSEFSSAEMAELEAQLQEWTHKPEGVAVVPSSSIPRLAARGRSADSLARMYLDGPPANMNGSQPAYLYILIYDSRIDRVPLQSPRARELQALKNIPAGDTGRPKNPHVSLSPYPAMIYMDRGWLGGALPQKYWKRALFHEAGHAIGLVGRESQVDNRHCPTDWCLMYAHASTEVWHDIVNCWRRKKPKPLLCEACATELSNYRTATNAISTRFAGSVMVRDMPVYHVLALPGFCGLYIGDSVDREIPGFLKTFHGLEEHKYNWAASYSQESMDRPSLLRSIEAAKRDFDPLVRHAAGELEREIRTTAEPSTGQGKN